MVSLRYKPLLFCFASFSLLNTASTQAQMAPKQQPSAKVPTLHDKGQRWDLRISYLKSEIVKQEAKRQRLLGVYTPKSPQVQAVDHKLVQLRHELKQANALLLVNKRTQSALQQRLCAINPNLRSADMAGGIAQ